MDRVISSADGARLNADLYIQTARLIHTNWYVSCLSVPISLHCISLISFYVFYFSALAIGPLRQAKKRKDIHLKKINLNKL